MNEQWNKKTSPVILDDFDFFAKSIGTPKESAVREAIAIPDASIVSTLVTPQSE